MGGAVKKIASAATLGLSDSVLGGLETPSTSSTNPNDVAANDVSNASAEGLAADKRRRAKAAGLSSTILGGAAGAPPTTAGKTLLGA